MKLIKLKSTVIGVLGSFFTVVLMYHLVELNTRPVYTHYLDSTEITNYTLLASLLSVQDTPISPGTTPTYNTTDGLVLYTDKPTSAFLDLVCQWNHTNVHWITFDTMVDCQHVVNHKIQHKSELHSLLEQIAPRVVIYQSKDAWVPMEGTTWIHLPDVEEIHWLSDLSMEALEAWHTPQIKLIVSTSGKKKSMQVKRLFESIQAAEYLNDQLDLFVLMDEKTDTATMQFIHRLPWKHGEKQMRHRIATVHPMQHFVESWYPSSDHEYAILLDDRVQVSTGYYLWLKYALLKYRYSSRSTPLFGISLYAPRIIDTDPTGRQYLHKSTDYWMQLPSSTALYFPEYWREFHDYITARLTDQSIVKRGSGRPHLFKDSLLTISRTNRWIHSWRKYFDEMIYMRGYVMLYPQQSYATLYLSFKKDTPVSQLYNVPMTTTVATLADHLPLFDLHGQPVQQTQLIERGHQLQRKFSACEPKIDHHHDPSDMLCPFSRLIQVPIDQDHIPIQSVSLYS
ncbi:uncharacterized protein B0P05DRAFT_589099 [Gilbertella persicaria]|uniref:uncharacterized protein n=1 Tax=Gilbertella persicaria TaxID=101096 RepID=UPI0022203D93|nr:uncharacterized protein B0P05DRAFT_589099 [Gilbertella persicaria]KAI8070570.1 hypothetical protein B0P05DRAFT_589099 [Gilbertella persicaria]